VELAYVAEVDRQIKNTATYAIFDGIYHGLVLIAFAAL
jgi:hypothetical protein